MKTTKNSLILLIIGIVFLISCKSNDNKKQEELLKLGIHTILAKEVVQTSQYTYIRFQEIGNPINKDIDTLWCAITSMDVKISDTLYYKGGFAMKQFQSKELGRTFAEVLFIDDISKTDDFVKREIAAVPSHQQMESTDSAMVGKPKIEKANVKIDKVAGGISIAELYANKTKYEGKTVKIKGQVTKFSPEIMEKNWIHMQDGTESNGKFDLTITTKETVKVGDIIIIEGKIALNKDLGYSYFYEVLLEEAKIIK